MQGANGFKSLTVSWGSKGKLKDATSHIAWLAEAAQQLRSACSDPDTCARPRVARCALAGSWLRLSRA